MILPATLFILFTLLAVAGLFWILYYHRGWRVATLWSALLLLAFVLLAWFVWWIVRTEAGSL